ncbi:unnamed protein product, partial [Brassica napus]
RERESHRISGSSSSSRSCRWISSSSRSARTRCVCIRVLLLTAHGVSVEPGRTFYRSGGCVIILRPPSFFR